MRTQHGGCWRAARRYESRATQTGGRPLTLNPAPFSSTRCLHAPCAASSPPRAAKWMSRAIGVCCMRTQRGGRWRASRRYESYAARKRGAGLQP